MGVTRQMMVSRGIRTRRRATRTCAWVSGGEHAALSVEFRSRVRPGRMYVDLGGIDGGPETRSVLLLANNLTDHTNPLLQRARPSTRRSDAPTREHVRLVGGLRDARMTPGTSRSHAVVHRRDLDRLRPVAASPRAGRSGSRPELDHPEAPISLERLHGRAAGPPRRPSGENAAVRRTGDVGRTVAARRRDQGAP
jgi:hypothetical protein